jgi:hypothetical protein
LRGSLFLRGRRSGIGGLDRRRIIGIVVGSIVVVAAAAAVAVVGMVVEAGVVVAVVLHHLDVFVYSLTEGAVEKGSGYQVDLLLPSTLVSIRHKILPLIISGSWEMWEGRVTAERRLRISLS